MPNLVYSYILDVYICFVNPSQQCSLTIQLNIKHLFTQLNDQNFYFKQFNLVLVKVKRFQVLLCIINISHLFLLHTDLKTVLFQIIQFSISTQFKCQTVLSNLLIGSHRMLLLQARVDLGMMGYSAFLKAPALLEPQH